jgi:hypothetical protein
MVVRPRQKGQTAAQLTRSHPMSSTVDRAVVESSPLSRNVSARPARKAPDRGHSASHLHCCSSMSSHGLRPNGQRLAGGRQGIDCHGIGLIASAHPTRRPSECIPMAILSAVVRCSPHGIRTLRSKHHHHSGNHQARLPGEMTSAARRRRTRAAPSPNRAADAMRVRHQETHGIAGNTRGNHHSRDLRGTA